MPFEPGKSGNPNGRPTKEAQALRNLTRTEVDTVLRKLKRAAPEAVSMIIAAMSSTEMSEKDRLKYAKEALDLYLKVVTIDHNLKKETGNATPVEDDVPATPAMVFRIA